ncbi:MAG: Anti-sigma factor NepR [Hyphomicrobiales bacterium]|jgi:hypothetical protein|nr:Anti-sigma factor NepR [Hyphomicrobiales bacterium]
MDENTKKKPRAISARPAVRLPEGGIAAVSVASMAGSQPAQNPAAHQMTDAVQVIEGGAKPGPNVKAYIERQLKSVYDDVLNQPIPDRFLDLLNGLDGKKEGGE